MITLTNIQFLGACFLSGFGGALFNEIISKVEELYYEYKNKKQKQKSN